MKTTMSVTNSITPTPPPPLPPPIPSPPFAVIPRVTDTISYDTPNLARAAIIACKLHLWNLEIWEAAAVDEETDESKLEAVAVAGAMDGTAPADRLSYAATSLSD
ncbi:hypothetical protein ONZ45_g14405 [Pleurotus djamor]|nr:hypothetical protein ONZ45_g14405 [Pleurotus djamor]